MMWHRTLGRIPFVQTGFGFYRKIGFGLHVQMLWTVWFWCGCLGNVSNISVPAKGVSKKRLHYRRDFYRPNAFAVRFSSVHFGRMRGQNHYVSLRFNMVSVLIGPT